MTFHPLDDIAQRLLGKAASDLDREEHRVLVSMQEQSPLSRDAADVADERATFGQRLSDKVAIVGGSWSFVIVFLLTLFAWMVLNTDVLGAFGRAFDPYPYIFLNLMLSMVAAIQAPIIMMSQNRQAAKDRVAASLDYEVNLRAELEILRLHQKIDQAVAVRLEEVVAMQTKLLAAMEDRRGSEAVAG